ASNGLQHRRTANVVNRVGWVEERSDEAHRLLAVGLARRLARPTLRKIPYQRRRVLATGDEVLAVRRKCQGEDPSAMAAVLFDFGPGLHVPQVDWTVPGAGREPLAVGGKRKADRSSVETRDCLDDLPRFGVANHSPRLALHAECDVLAI